MTAAVLTVIWTYHTHFGLKIKGDND